MLGVPPQQVASFADAQKGSTENPGAHQLRIVDGWLIGKVMHLGTKFAGVQITRGEVMLTG